MRIRVGILNGMFGNMKDAEAMFREVIRNDPTLTSPYVNVANIRLLAGDTDGALAMVNQGLVVNKASALLNLLASRIYASRGDAAQAATYMARVKSVAPDLAESSGVAAGQSQRAAGQGEPIVVIWGNEK